MCILYVCDVWYICIECVNPDMLQVIVVSQLLALRQTAAAALAGPKQTANSRWPTLKLAVVLHIP